jgi:type I restriction enzyme S subunit
LRFPGFEGEWEDKKLGEIAVIGRGKSKHRPRDAEFLFGGKYPFIQTGDIRKADLYLTKFTQTYSEAGLNQSKLWDENTLCITIAANIAETAVLKIKACFPDSVIGLIPKEDQAIVLFVKHLFDKFKVEIQNLSQGAAQDNLNQEKLSKIQFSFPSIVEQRKIASFLSIIDERITTQSKIIQRLETSIRIFRQKLFTQKNRFKNINGTDFPEWEEKKLKEISSKQIQKNNDFKVKSVLTNSAVSGIINQRDFFDKDIANDNNINSYYVVEKDDFVYNPRISNEAPVGPISRNTIGIGIMSPLYMVFRFNEINLDFIEQFYKSTIWHLHMESIANYGARADRMSFSSNDFFKMPLILPSRKEQEAIANFLCSIENKIKTEKRILKQYEIQKKHLLQNVFI